MEKLAENETANESDTYFELYEDSTYQRSI